MSAGTVLHGTAYTTPTAVLHNPWRIKAPREHLDQPKSIQGTSRKEGEGYLNSP